MGHQKGLVEPLLRGQLWAVYQEDTFSMSFSGYLALAVKMHKIKPIEIRLLDCIALTITF